jgi:hypothetical protein
MSSLPFSHFNLLLHICTLKWYQLWKRAFRIVRMLLILHGEGLLVGLKEGKSSTVESLKKNSQELMCDLRQVSGFLGAHWFPPPIKQKVKKNKTNRCNGYRILIRLDNVWGTHPYNFWSHHNICSTNKNIFLICHIHIFYNNKQIFCYNWNIVESDVKNHIPNPNTWWVGKIMLEGIS